MQATSVTMDVHGKVPLFSMALKTATTVASNIVNRTLAPNSNRDHDTAVQQVALHHKKSRATERRRTSFAGDDNDQDSKENSTTGPSPSCASERAKFAYIVTRPTAFLTDGPSSTKKVAASKSQPGPFFPIAHVDLAEFSLNALLTKKLYHTCPYVVADSM
jgi:hypothetical protein